MPRTGVPNFRRETAGADMEQAKSKTCGRCKAPLVLAMVRNAAGTLKWRNFDAKAIERDGRRFYLAHYCPR
jgi:hypothetical protein